MAAAGPVPGAAVQAPRPPLLPAWQHRTSTWPRMSSTAHLLHSRSHTSSSSCASRQASSMHRGKRTPDQSVDAECYALLSGSIAVESCGHLQRTSHIKEGRKAALAVCAERCACRSAAGCRSLFLASRAAIIASSRLAVLTFGPQSPAASGPAAARRALLPATVHRPQLF